MLQILFCEDPGVVRLLYLFKTSLNLIRFIIPIGLIIMISLDLYKNMLEGSENNKENVIKKSGNRILAAIIVFITPTLVNLLFSLFSLVDINTNADEISFSTCFKEASKELANQLEDALNQQLNAEEEVARQNASVKAAEQQAKNQALIEENILNDNKNNGSTGTIEGGYYNNTTDLNMQNKVYVQNGTFYAPAYKYNDQSTFSGMECPSGNPESQGYNNPYGYNNYFWDMLTKLKEAAIRAGYNLGFDKQGCRSYSSQISTSKKYANQPGRAASPGKSNHGWGIASDVIFYKDTNTQCGSTRTRSNCPGMAWVHDHAKEYGLHFPLNNSSAKFREDWHIEPINLKKY